MFCINISKILKLSRIQKFILFSRVSILGQFSYFLNMHLLKLIFISYSKVCAYGFRKPSVVFYVDRGWFFVAFNGAGSADADVVGIDIKWFKIFIYRNAITDLQIIIFNDKITPLQVIVRVVENNVVSKLWYHFLQNIQNFLFIRWKSSLRSFRIYQVHLI